MKLKHAILTVLCAAWLIIFGAPAYAAFPADAIPEDFKLWWDAPVRAHPSVPLVYRLTYYEIDNRPLRWSMSGAPAGMTLDQSGNISWTTPVTGTYQGITITVRRASCNSSDYANCRLSVSHTFTLTVGTSDFVFVSTSGTDNGGCGAIGAPCAKLSYAMTNKISGTDGKTIYVRGGSYNDNWNNISFNGITFPVSDHMDILPYPGETPTITITTNHGILLESTSYVNIAVNIIGSWQDSKANYILTCTHCIVHDVVTGLSRSGDNSAAVNVSGDDAVINRVVAYNNWETKILSGTLSSSGAVVTGVGTNFDPQVMVGSILIHPSTGAELVVLSIASDTSLTLTSTPSPPLSGATILAHRTPSGSGWNNNGILAYNDISNKTSWVLNSKAYDTEACFKIKHTNGSASKTIFHNNEGMNCYWSFMGAGINSSFRYGVSWKTTLGIFMGSTDPSAYTPGKMLIEHMTAIGDTTSRHNFGAQGVEYGSTGPLTFKYNISYQDNGACQSQNPEGSGTRAHTNFWYYTTQATAIAFPFYSDLNMWYNANGNTDCFHIGNPGFPSPYSFTGWKALTGTGITRDPNSVATAPGFTSVGTGNLNVSTGSNAATSCGGGQANSKYGDFCGAFKPGKTFGTVGVQNTTLLNWDGVQTFSSNEICGSGASEDGTGVISGTCGAGYVPAIYGPGCDKLCAAPDQDADGYYTAGGGPLSGIDCDDTDKTIYPGVYTTTGCSSGQYHKCQADGTYTTCSGADFCPGECSSCRYVDWRSGSNSNNGQSVATAWKDYLPFSSYYDAPSTPAYYEAPVAGRCYIFRNGTYNSTYSYNGEMWMFKWRNLGGTAGSHIRVYNYPGHNPILNGSGTSAAADRVIGLQSTSYIDIQGLEITDNYCNGTLGNAGCLTVVDSDHINISLMKIHDNDGDRPSNTAGIVTHTTNTTSVNHSGLWDNFDQTQGGNSPGGDIFDFDSVSLDISDNTLFQVHQVGQKGFFQKHGVYGGSVSVLRNKIQNNSDGILIAGPNFNVHNNIISDSTFAFRFVDPGGTSFQAGTMSVSYNTILNSRLLAYNPQKGYNSDNSPAGDQCSGNVPITTLNVTNNIIVDNSASYPAESEMYAIHIYGPDALYTDVVTGGKLNFNQNCFYNTLSTALAFNVFGSNNGVTTCSGRGNSGTSYASFALWQAAGFDAASYSENPALNDNLKATSTHCATWGWNGNLPSTPEDPAPSRRGRSNPVYARKPKR